MKLIQYNIWKSQYVNEVAHFLKDQQPDFICMQEVHSTVPEAHGNIDDAFTIISNITGLEGRFAPAMYLTDKILYGNAVLSRHHIIETRMVFLSGELIHVSERPDARTEPRIAVFVKVDVTGHALWIGSTHMTFDYDFVTSDLHMQQAEVLQDAIATLDAPVILGGDFNALPNSAVDQLFRKQLTNVSAEIAGPTFAKHPFLKHDNVMAGLEYTIDHIYTSPEITTKNVYTMDVDPSDHLPIVYEFDL